MLFKNKQQTTKILITTTKTTNNNVNNNEFTFRSQSHEKRLTQLRRV